MVEIIRALILGIIQGLTEFLPVSSSAHLNLFPWMMGWEITDSFDVALHIGTLLAMIVFFFKDWVNLVAGGCRTLFKKEKNVQGTIFWKLFFVTIPAALLSVVLDKVSEKIIGENINVEMLIIAITLIVMGIVLFLADRFGKNNISYKNISWRDSFLIGLSQAIAAAFPGVSRSGITMTVARALGVKRSAAAKFSFMLAMPITLGAVIFDIDKFAGMQVGPFVVGVLASFIVGIFVIKFLLDFLKKRSFMGFGIYRVVLGIIVIILYFVRV